MIFNIIKPFIKLPLRLVLADYYTYYWIVVQEGCKPASLQPLPRLLSRGSLWDPTGQRGRGVARLRMADFSHSMHGAHVGSAAQAQPWNATVW